MAKSDTLFVLLSNLLVLLLVVFVDFNQLREWEKVGIVFLLFSTMSIIYQFIGELDKSHK